GSRCSAARCTRWCSSGASTARTGSDELLAPLSRRRPSAATTPPRPGPATYRLRTLSARSSPAEGPSRSCADSLRFRVVSSRRRRGRDGERAVGRGRRAGDDDHRAGPVPAPDRLTMGRRGSGRRRIRSVAGQASVELVSLLPLVVVVGLAVGQLLLAGAASEL